MRKIAVVTWKDARRTDDQVTGTEDPGVIRETVGWVLRDDEEGVVIAFTWDGNENYERGFMIPRELVKSRKWVKRDGDRA